MATVWMVEAVQRNRVGDVVRVRWGKADTTANRWRDGDPHEVAVIEVVDQIMAGTEVWSRMPSGAPGPKVRTVLAQGGAPGIETVALDENPQGYTVADLAQF